MKYLFVNKNKRNTDKKNCQRFSQNFFEFFVITKLFTAKKFYIEKTLQYLILQKYSVLLKSKFNYKTVHKDISFLSGRTRVAYTKYGLARTDFKKLMSLHQIPNLKKSSW